MNPYVFPLLLALAVPAAVVSILQGHHVLGAGILTALVVLFWRLRRGGAADPRIEAAAIRARREFDNPEAQWHYGAILQANRRYGEALAAFDKALQIDDGCIEALIGSAQALQLLHRLEEALARFRLAEACDKKGPHTLAVHAGIFFVLLDLHRIPEATERLDQLRRLDPQRASHYEEALLARTS